MIIGSLFSGIGGLELGLERAGLGWVRWQVEINPFARAILSRHWPYAQRAYTDVREVGERNLMPVDIICGGFPCQDISNAGSKEGIGGLRSGLWAEFVRVVRELRPRYVIVENVAALLDRGMGHVLGTLADIGYDAEWSCVSACSVGAPHMRRRLFVVAYPHGQHGGSRVWDQQRVEGALQSGDCGASADADKRVWLADPSSLYRGADGVPFGMDRVRALGNAVVHQVAEVIGRRILAMEARSEAW